MRAAHATVSWETNPAVERELSGLCRHPLLLTQVSAAGLRKLPMEWGLTLLISQPTLSVAVERLLSIGRKCIGFIPEGGHLLDLQCGLATYVEIGCLRFLA